MTRRRRYQPDELAFIHAHKHLSRGALHAAFVATFGRHDVTPSSMKSLCARLRWARRETWTADEDLALRDWFPMTPTVLLAAELGRSHSAVSQRARKLGVVKNPEYLAMEAGRIARETGLGVATRFAPGHTPANKGQRRPGWAPGRMAETQFRPRIPSWRYQPVGSTRVVDGYEYTKTADTPKVAWTKNWRPTHILRWEALHGPVPKGHALKSLDGNRLNTAPDNWTAVPRAIMPLLNGGRSKRRIAFDQAPAELKPTLLALANLQHAAKRRQESPA